jgi:hypothetical protein
MLDSDPKYLPLDDARRFESIWQEANGVVFSLENLQLKELRDLFSELV